MEGLSGPGLRGLFSGGRHADAAEGAPPPAAADGAAGTKAARVWAGRRAGSLPGPAQPSPPGAPHPPELSCAVRSRVSRGRAAAGAAARAGGEQCEEGGREAGGEGGAVSPRRQSRVLDGARRV